MSKAAENKTPKPEPATRIPVNPGNIDVTQKIELNYSEIAGDSKKTQAPSSAIKIKHKDPGKTVSGISVFSRRRIADDYVKSNSMIITINSVPPLKDEFELQDINCNYELKDKFASGAQGIIRAAFDKSLKRDIVVKSLKKEGADELAEKDENLFVSEARIMAQLDHPSIIPLYGLHSGKEEPLHLAMKHIHGKTLRKYLKDIIVLYDREGVAGFDEKRSMANRMEYLIKVCEAVDYAHCKGVVDRDLKPENIMIGNYGEVYVMDWGLSCLVKPEKGQPQDSGHSENELVGTPCYIAPEIIKGGSCSPQSDIFSLGMMLFEIVNLQRAVTARTVKGVLRNIIRSKFHPFKHLFLKSAMPADLKAIFDKAACESLDKRYQSAGEMARDLRLYLMHEETGARPDNLSRRLIRTMINHKTITAIIILTILLCFAGVSIHSLHSSYILMSQQKERENMLAFFQYKTAGKAHEMDDIFSFFKSQLGNLGYHCGSILTRKPSFNPPVYTIEDYRKSSTAPPDYTYSPAYGQKISLDRAVLKLGPGLKKEDEIIKRTVTLEPMLKHIMFRSDRSFKADEPEKIKSHIMKEGVTLSWVYVGLKNGTTFSYPGGNIFRKDYDPRKRPWYRKAFAKPHEFIWSEPYPDAFSSKIVISCARCVYSVNDGIPQFRGVAGMDIRLDYIRERIFSKKRSDIKEYLLTNEGKVLLSSDFKSKNVETCENNATIVLKKFPFLKEFRNALINKNVLFEASGHAEKYIFSLYYMKSMGYYYVMRVSEKKLRAYWKKNISENISHHGNR